MPVPPAYAIFDSRLAALSSDQGGGAHFNPHFNRSYPLRPSQGRGGDSAGRKGSPSTSQGVIFSNHTLEGPRDPPDKGTTVTYPNGWKLRIHRQGSEEQRAQLETLLVAHIESFSFGLADLPGYTGSEGPFPTTSSTWSALSRRQHQASRAGPPLCCTETSSR